ncbi:hypothetical protein FGO68_gene1338 [Halteria grandinella]|uniref:Uncharacterized protein n=1 Tax=Halteria grandinella TaxID=5974 RepID=A0A8J8NYF7_HALGN|nr:hypothetical protein FGO68_gene1338 [Halteria grandinella]
MRMSASIAIVLFFNTSRLSSINPPSFFIRSITVLVLGTQIKQIFQIVDALTDEVLLKNVVQFCFISIDFALSDLSEKLFLATLIELQLFQIYLPQSWT